MMRILALTLLLAGCAASPLARPVAIPAVLLSCPAGPAVPIPPAKPRTIDSISAWGNRNEIALRRALAALAECDRRRRAVVGLQSSEISKPHAVRMTDH